MKIVFIYQPFESIGIEILSSFLKKHGHQVELLVDYDFFADGFLNINFLHRLFHFEEKIIADIQKLKPNLLAFSVVTDYYLWAINLAKRLKKETKLPIIFGGIHPTIMPQQVLQNKFIDIVCQGEGEYALLELAERFDKNGEINPQGISNLWYRKKNGFIKGNLCSLVEDLNKLPFADKELFYEKLPRFKSDYWIMTSRGCPFNCSYCWNSFYRRLYLGKGKYLRRRSVDNVIQELVDAQEKWNYKRITFLDDLFAFDLKWLQEFAKKFKKSKVFGKPYSCTGHPKVIDEKKIKILKSTGCDEIELGVQTASDRTRREIIFRPETNQDILKASSLVKKAGINLILDHIGALPTEGEKEQLEAVKLYNQIRPRYVSFFWLRYYPGTEIQKVAIKKKEITEKQLKKMETGKEFFDPYRFYGKKAKQFIPFEYLIGVITIIPAKIVDFIINKKIYKYLSKPSFILGQGLSRVLVALFQLDSRFIRSFIARYTIDFPAYLRKNLFK